MTARARQTADPVREAEQIRQNGLRSERYQADPAYRAARLQYNRPYVAKANQRRAEQRAAKRGEA